jgi:hypothetical protein
MCVYSMVMDHYSDRFNRQWPGFGEGNPWRMPAPVNPMIPSPPIDREAREAQKDAQKDWILQLQKLGKPPKPSPEVEALRELIKEFREALAAAKLVDVLTDQPDCEDPVKAKLEDRVKALEKHLGL